MNGTEHGKLRGNGTGPAANKCRNMAAAALLLARHPFPSHNMKIEVVGRVAEEEETTKTAVGGTVIVRETQTIASPNVVDKCGTTQVVSHSTSYESNRHHRNNNRYRTVDRMWWKEGTDT